MNIAMTLLYGNELESIMPVIIAFVDRLLTRNIAVQYNEIAIMLPKSYLPEAIVCKTVFQH